MIGHELQSFNPESKATWRFPRLTPMPQCLHRPTLNNLASLLPLLPSVRHLVLLAHAALLANCLLGCTDGKSTVNGTVTFDSQPVASGAITFVKQDGELAREGAVIQNGSFRATIPPGKYKLELHAQKVISKRKQKAFDGSDEEVETTAELFPARYNTQSELLQELKPGANTIKLDLKSG
jgi:hypothetical protein